MSDWEYPTAFTTWSYGDGGEESEAIDRVLRSGRYTMGPEVEAFESELAAYHGREHAVCVNSGSSANLVAVGAYVHQFNGVFNATVPAVAWSTTYAPLLQRGLPLRVMDVDATWNAVAPRHRPTRGTLLVTCPVLGNAAHMSIDAGIEDACESAGARDAAGRLAGTFGVMSTGSGYWSHQVSCVEMGWVLTDDGDLARLCRLLRNHGNAGWGAPEWGARYDFVLPGYNLRPLEMHAAVGRAQLRKLDAGNAERRADLVAFRSACKARNLPVIFPTLVGEPAPFGIAFEVEDAARRAPLVAALAAAGVDSRPPTGGSFTAHPYGAAWRERNPTPRADLVHRRGLFLGNAPVNIDRQMELAVRVMREVL